MAHKKAGGSSKNGRDSHGQRRGIKVYSGEVVTGGSILVRQCGTKVYPGANVGAGRDWTLYAKIPGRVEYFNRDNKKWVKVIEAVAAA